MSAGAMRGRPRRQRRDALAVNVGGAVYVAAMTVLAAVAAWPIYRSASFALLVAVSAVLAGGVAALAHRRGWSAGVVGAVLAGSVLVLGVPLAVPSRLGGPADLLAGLVETASGAVLGWKDLVTVDLPVGTYRNLLVPALIVFLGGVCAALLLAWRPGRLAYAATAVTVAMVSFGLFFGRTSTSAALVVGPVVLPAPVETGVGVGALVATLLWAAHRTRRERLFALERAAASSGVHLTRGASRTDRRRALLGAGMIAVAVLVAVAVVPAAAQSRERDVLRAAAGPEVDISRAVSPLSTYRSLFADDRADQVLFTVTSDGSLPDRVRLATLDAYDGEVFRSGDDDASRFVRVPSVRDAGEGAPVDATVSIGALTGIWMPTAGRLAGVRFGGDRAVALADRFYYDDDAEAGVQTAGGGLAQGDTYDLTAVERPAQALADATPPGVGDGVLAPESLRAWVEEHATGADGAALAGLVTLLRERGFLSHALTAPRDPLPGYVFQPSAAGHSLARIDELFAKLLARESDPRAASTGNYVAAVGDDEQFAVATALIARELGFPSRVVLGARLESGDPGVSTCDGGECRAQDLSAWTEVRSSSGEWIPVDVTPQYAVAPSLEQTELRDPEIPTEVRPDGVTDVVPPPPVQDDDARDDPRTDPGADLAWLWTALRAASIVLLVMLVLCGPLALIAAAKSMRRRSRRRIPGPARRIAEGWEEYLDAAADAGRAVPAELTREEAAAMLGTPAAGALAAEADRAVFSDRAPSADEAVEYWRLVDADRRSLVGGRGAGRRLRAAVSLRSFLRFLAPAPPRTVPPVMERGRRSTSARARPST
ncbi:transglutaminase domain-containing protein [Microbacterium lemovicicum]|nr:transglutaminase domain-containing protein [Microbacterium lemovicicum]